MKIIHQIWLQGKDKIPDKFKKNIKKNITINFDWEYKLWDSKSITELIKFDKNINNTYHKLKYMHQKIDFAKYIILYIYGGIYIDMDAYTIKNLNILIQNYNNYDLIVSKLNCNILENYIHCSRKYCINNGVIYAKPKCSILLKMIQYIITNYKCSNNTNKISCIEQTTGPKKFTDIIMDNLNENVKILEPEYLEPCIFNNCNITDNTYVVHEHNGSWYPNWLKQIFIIYLNNKIICYVVFMFVIYFFILS